MIELEKYIAGHYEKGAGGYNYFVPAEINRQWNWKNPEINSLLERAAIKLGGQSRNRVFVFEKYLSLFRDVRLTE